MMNWYLAYCRPREEQRASQHLRNQGIDSYYPMVEVERLVRGKREKRMEPMFPCYLFVQVDLEAFSPTRLNATRGLRHMVRFGNHWSCIPSRLIYDMMCREDSDALRARMPQLPKCGDRVIIGEGSFHGLEAIYQEPDGEHRSILLLTMFKQQIPVTLDNREFALA